MKMLKRLWLFVHAVPRTPEQVTHYFKLWEELMAAEGDDETTALCLLSNAPPEMEQLRQMGKKHFGDRCFIDPSDSSDATKILIADDLDRLMQQRGSYTEWIPYEIGTSSGSRRWAEGLKKEIAAAGYGYEPEKLTVRACGQQWIGCLSKYSLFMTKYLGSLKPVEFIAELSPNAGFPMAASPVEAHLMGHGVWLHLFVTADGYPMAQLMDGLRGVWEPLHAATVPIDPARAELICTSPNAYIPEQGVACKGEDHVVMDVGDGCHPSYSTLVAPHMEYDEFREALLGAEINDRDDRNRTLYAVPYLASVRMNRGKDE